MNYNDYAKFCKSKVQMVEQATKKADSQANKLLVTENDALVIDAVKNKALQRLCQTKVI